jgi:GTP-binding protein
MLRRLACLGRRLSSTRTSGNIRNIAIIAHVDHGKTTLVDSLLKNSGLELKEDCVMDSNQLEREKGITILSKATGIFYRGHRINIVDTPGHHDFGGEVERIMNMVDGVCLLVCATEGPMTQTRFVLRKALDHAVRPMVVINKVDRPTARVKDVENEIFELFCDLNCPEELTNYPVYYASGKNGWAVRGLEDEKLDCRPILDGIIEHIPSPKIPPAPSSFTMLVSQTEPNSFFGKMAIGRINTGAVRLGDRVAAYSQDQAFLQEGKVTRILKKMGLGQVELPEAEAGDIVCLSGLPQANVTDILCEAEKPFLIPATKIDPPLMGISVAVNTSPLAGKDGSKIAFNDIRKRLEWESENDVALKLEVRKDTIEVRGRGDLHLGLLIEKIRREGFEMTVTPPQILYRTVNGERLEPFEKVSIEVPTSMSHDIMDRMNNRRGSFQETKDLSEGMVRMTFIVPSRGLIGLRSELLNDTKGTAVLQSQFHEYAPDVGPITKNNKGAIVSMTEGVCTTYGLRDVEKHGLLFVRPGTRIYPGMVIGECIKEHDLDCNPTKEKKLTNVRTHAHDEKIVLNPAWVMSIEEAICYVRDSELIEVTPKDVRIRKRILDKQARDKARRESR